MHNNVIHVDINISYYQCCYQPYKEYADSGHANFYVSYNVI